MYRGRLLECILSQREQKIWKELGISEYLEREEVGYHDEREQRDRDLYRGQVSN